MADDDNREAATDLLSLTADIVAAHAANNSIPAAELPTLISGVYEALAGLGKAASDGSDRPYPAKGNGAVTARKSLASRDFIISMIDGKEYKTLKRHLSTHGLSPAEYRRRYGLKPDYPLTAPAYSERRSALAKTIGLGTKTAPKAKKTTAATARARKPESA